MRDPGGRIIIPPPFICALFSGYIPGWLFPHRLHLLRRTILRVGNHLIVHHVLLHQISLLFLLFASFLRLLLRLLPALLRFRSALALRRRLAVPVAALLRLQRAVRGHVHHLRLRELIVWLNHHPPLHLRLPLHLLLVRHLNVGVLPALVVVLHLVRQLILLRVAEPHHSVRMHRRHLHVMHPSVTLSDAAVSASHHVHLSVHVVPPAAAASIRVDVRRRVVGRAPRRPDRCSRKNTSRTCPRRRRRRSHSGPPVCSGRPCRTNDRTASTCSAAASPRPPGTSSRELRSARPRRRGRCYPPLKCSATAGCSGF